MKSSVPRVLRVVLALAGGLIRIREWTAMRPQASFPQRVRTVWRRILKPVELGLLFATPLIGPVALIPLCDYESGVA
jgi:hypothetical protein